MFISAMIMVSNWNRNKMVTQSGTRSSSMTTSCFILLLNNTSKYLPAIQQRRTVFVDLGVLSPSCTPPLSNVEVKF